VFQARLVGTARVRQARSSDRRIGRSTAAGSIVLGFGTVDDEDIVEYFVEYHRSIGVDAFVCVDVGSTDRTLDILARYERAGYLHLTRRQNPQTGGGYHTKEWSFYDGVVTARERYNAQWCLFGDVDEFWVFPDNDAAAYFSSAPGSIVTFPRYNMLPTREPATDALLHFSRFTMLVRRPVEFTYDISPQGEPPDPRQLLDGYPPDILRAVLPKVAARTNVIQSISRGFHDVTPIDPATPRHRETAGYIAHFPVRSLPQFRRKMELVARFVDRPENPQDSAHWTRLAALYKQGLVSAEFVRQAPSYADVEALVREGVLESDDTIARRLAELFPIPCERS
jgi:Glycosyl transferase family 2